MYQLKQNKVFSAEQEEWRRNPSHRKKANEIYKLNYSQRSEICGGALEF
jgi:hypothetical protein